MRNWRYPFKLHPLVVNLSRGGVPRSRPSRQLPLSRRSNLGSHLGPGPRSDSKGPENVSPERSSCLPGIDIYGSSSSRARQGICPTTLSSPALRWSPPDFVWTERSSYRSYPLTCNTLSYSNRFIRWRRPCVDRNVSGTRSASTSKLRH